MEKENNVKNDFSRQQTKNIQQTTKDQRPSQEAQPPSKEDKNQPQKTPQNYTSKTILQNNEPHHIPFVTLETQLKDILKMRDHKRNILVLER